MRRLSAAAATLAGLCLTGCFAPRMTLREPTDPGHGAILMSVRIKGSEFPYFRSHDAKELFFSRLHPDKSIDPVLVPSNWRAGDRQYALDLPPGQYVLVAAAYFTGRSRQLARFTEAQSLAWITTVKAGEISFGGAILLARPFPGTGEALMNLLRRASSYLPPFRRAAIQVHASAAKTDRSHGVEAQALRFAREDLAGTFWLQAVEARLRALGDPPPVLTEGKTFRKKRPVPRLRAEHFTWIETLGWGPPREIPGGMEWRRPKSRTAVSVAFFPQTGPGARSLELELQTLREAGGPEDTHTLRDVYVSSRPAQSARYTTYVYPETSLVGSEVEVYKTESVVVPAKEGFYRLQYRALAEEFERWRGEFVRFVRYLDLSPPQKTSGK